jgi:uncharacterized protein
MAEANRPLALVTGASSGIGADLARELARDGHDLVLTARRGEPLGRLAAELAPLGARATIITADLSKPGAAAELDGQIQSRGLVIEVLINNAGFGDAAPFHEAEPAKLSAILQVNVLALTELTRLALPGMVARRRGRVMLVASTAGFQPGPGMAVYCASKAYVLSLGQALSQELRRTGVKVTTLCPGATATGFAAAANAQDRPLFKRKLIPVMDSAEVAAAGYAALKAGRPVVVTGALNKLTAATTRLVPRRILLPVSQKIFGRPDAAR